MKLLFVIPSLLVSYEEFSAPPYVSLPLGVLSMAAFLRAQNWPGEIEVYDARLSARRSTNEKGESVFGDSDEEVEAHIAASGADIVGITNMFTSQFSRALRTAELAKRASPNCITVLGGPHVSAFPEAVIEEPAVDFVVMGEGEERLLHLLDDLREGSRPSIQGVLGSLSDKELLRPNPKVRIRFIKEIDDLPIPAYELVDVERYFHLQSHGYSPRPREWGKRAVTLITSRGCPHQCVFCSIQTTMGYKWRPHSVDYVMRHIHYLRENYGIDFIHFEDDNFSHDPIRYDHIIEGLLTLDTVIPWDTPNGIRGDTWTAERVRKTKQSGCQYLTVAIESTSQRVLDKVVKKRLDLSKVSAFMSYCRDEKLRLNAFYVIGLPGETWEEIKGTVYTSLRYYLKYGVWPTVSIAMPLPGTELHEIVSRHGYHNPEDGFGRGVIETPEFSGRKLNRLYKQFIILKTLIFVARTFSSAAEFSYSARLLTRFRRSVAETLYFVVKGLGRQTARTAERTQP